VDTAALRRALHHLDAAAGRFMDGPPPGEITVLVLTDLALARLHADYLDDPTPTDVMTFPGDPAFGVAGDIAVSADTAARYAAAHARNFAAELTLYVVHGWLHLAGYDDRTPAAKRRMRAAEHRALTLLAQAGITPAHAWRK
jgi:probable rRNA maturation factor